MKLGSIVLSLTLLLGSVEPALAFNQPPVNLGATSYLDGGPIKPGFYLVEYLLFINGIRPVDKDGHVIPGGAAVTASTWLNQFVYFSPVQVAGGNLGLDVVVPIVNLAVKGDLGGVPLTANTGGLGDLVVGPMIQWNGGTLLGRPFPQRIESDVTLPTGKYDANFSVNPGSNLVTVDSYYAFSWFFAEHWETSWRIWYAFNSQNGATQVKPGQLFHANFALSREVDPRLRLGVNGYVLKQTTDDRIAGVAQPGSREQAFAVGPGLIYQNPAFLLMLSNPIEFDVRNRFEGTRTTLQFIHKF